MALLFCQYVLFRKNKQNKKLKFCSHLFTKQSFFILAKKTPSSRSVKGHSPVSRWEMNWLP
ncbi:hypothetical protein CBR59_24300 [Bacillus thuringiensis]|nr:hypothetical protein CBP87_25845 [Bacillus thuringiensis]PNK52009.1 hypothetical protein CBR59_24300 [Bacillus thuringiensis]